MYIVVGYVHVYIYGYVCHIVLPAQDRRDTLSGPALERLLERLNTLEGSQPKVEKRLAELDGKALGRR